MDSNDVRNEENRKKNRNRNKNKRYWKKRNASRDNNRKKIEKAKNLRNELLKLQEHINDKYHSG